MKRKVQAKIFSEDRDLLLTLKREIAEAQNADCSIAEVLRRTNRISGVRDALIADARAKRRLRR